MVQLFIWKAADGLPSASPYCLKVIYALRYKGIPHQLVVTPASLPAWIRRGKLPAAILDNGGRSQLRIEDSTAILKALETFAPGAPKLYPSTAAERVEALMIEDWADEWFSLHLVYERWAVRENFERFSAQIFAGFPAILKMMVVPSVRKGVIRSLESRSIGLYSPKEREDSFREGLYLLEQKLQNRLFLAGEEVSAADFSVYPHLKIMTAASMKRPMAAINESAGLTRWMRRFEEKVGTG